VADPIRLRDEAAPDELARLVRNERAPHPLSRAQLGRIEANLDAALAPPRKRRFVWVTVAALFAIAPLASLWWWRPQRLPVTTPAPAPVVLPVEPTRPANEQLEIRTEESPTVLAVGHARITIPARSRVKVRLNPALVVASSRGELQVKWGGSEHTYRIPDGGSWSPASSEPQAEPVEAREAPKPQRPRLAEDARALATALKLLRVQRSPSQALAHLEKNATRFASGPLEREADMVRAEALVQLGRRSEAVSILRAYSASELPPALGRLLRQ
jgi:hypothetical protein